MEQLTLNETDEDKLRNFTGAVSTTRRASTSSVETVTQETTSKAVTKSTEPCLPCQTLLVRALWHRQQKPYSRRFASLADLQSSAKRCPLCHLLWLVLRGADDALVDQILKYSSDTFNTMNLYLPDGGTDIEELVNPGPKVKLTATATLKYAPITRQLINTAFLRLRFHVAYKTQASSATYATTTVREHVTIFRALESTGSGINAKLDSDMPLPQKLPLDPRLELKGKWRLLRSWVNRASLTISMSWKQESINQYPRRALDVSQEGRVTLVESPRRPYAALSHRWGASKHLIATTHNLDTLKSGISLDTLPATFRDAAIVARRFGVKYLWIDALCIAQDDINEWHSESRNMGDIYTNAKFVIAAHCAADDSEGFLAKAFSKRSAILFTTGDGSECLGIYRRANLEADVTKSALSKRAWVLQERFLATHTLHFTKNGVFSEMATEVLSEDGNFNAVSAHIGTATFLGPAALPELHESLAVRSDQTKLLQTSTQWFNLVEMYTNCDLTREEDKLVAIAGIARRIQMQNWASVVTWCAGLWSDRISEGLLWFTGEAMSRPARSRAPSWSWAAWDGPVQYPRNVQQDTNFRPRAKFLSVRETNLSPDVAPMTWLGGPGVLRIQTKIIPLQDVILTSDSAQLGPGPDRRGYLTSDSRDLPRLELKHYLTAHMLRGHRVINKRRVIREDRLPPCGWISLDDRQAAPTESENFTDQSQRLSNHVFVVLGIYRSPSGGLAYLGIVLKAVHEPETGILQYRRIGCGQMSHSFIAGEDLDFWSDRQDEIGWSTKTDTAQLQVPSELYQSSVIDIH